MLIQFKYNMYARHRIINTLFDKLPIHILYRINIRIITILMSDGDVKPGGPLGAFREEQAMSWHRVSPSPFLS